MLIRFDQFDHIYLYRPFADFRKGLLGLATIVQDVMELNPFDKNLFIFCNKSRDALKVIYWDKNGLAMWHKKLQKQKYHWPSDKIVTSLAVEKDELEKFLEGLNPWQEPFKLLSYKKL